MKISKLILMSLASLLIVTEVAPAGKPVLGTVIESDHIYPWEMQRINATEWTESGDATKAFNFLQDSLGKPQVDEVWYDFDSDCFIGGDPRREPNGDVPGTIRKRDSLPLFHRHNGKTYFAITSLSDS